MNHKKWLTAAGIILVLAAAFFWGGGPIKPKESKTASPAIHETAAPHHVDQASDESGIEKREPTGTSIPSQPESTEGMASGKPELNEEMASVMPEPTEALSSGNGEALIPSNSEPSTPSNLEPSNPSNSEASTPSKLGASDKAGALTPGKSEASASGEPEAGSTSTPSKAEPIAAESESQKDKYLTDPVPEGKPKPVEWQDVTINKKKKLTATLSVTCDTILDNMDILNPDKLEVLPSDGIIYEARTVTFYEGESVFDVLLREMKANKIHMEFVMTPIYNSNYVEGINNLYEFDCGELSGWMYKVNGWFPNYGSSRYMLQDGDVIEWVYTCDLGRDVGGDWAVTGGGES